jgi:hypothetical protein
MFNISIELYVLSFDFEKNERCFVSTDSNVYLPLQKEIEHNSLSIEDNLAELFEKHIQLGFGWVKHIIIGVTKLDENINMCYACSIPPGTPLINSYYKSSNVAIINPLARKALLYV